MSSKKFFLFALCTICLITFASKVYSQEKNEKIISEKEYEKFEINGNK